MDISGVREGYVTIVKEGRKFVCKGMDVLGYSYGKPVRREIQVSKTAPPWFLSLCADYADTELKVRVRVVKLSGSEVAFIIPTASSLEEVLNEHKERYHVVEVPTSYDLAFKAHELYAHEHGLEVIEHVLHGLTSYTVVRDPRKLREFQVVGGMMINKVVKRYEPENEKWRQAFRSFVRLHAEEAIA